GPRGAEVFFSYAENEPIRKASEQPCRGGHGQRPVERTEKSEDYDGCDRRQDKVPEAVSASMANKRAGTSPTVLHVLAKQRNCIITRKVRNDEVICQPNPAASFD